MSSSIVRFIFTTRNTTYVVVQAVNGQYIGRFGTEAISLYTAESGTPRPEVGKQAVVHVLDHHGRYDRITTSTVKTVVLENLAEVGVIDPTMMIHDMQAMLSMDYEVGLTLSFAQQQEAKIEARIEARLIAKRQQNPSSWLEAAGLGWSEWQYCQYRNDLTNKVHPAKAPAL